jgi:hypothetical protein
MHCSGKTGLHWVLIFYLLAHPVRVFSQIYADAEYRFGAVKQNASDVELAQTGITSLRSIPYTLGGFTFSGGYAWRPDSLNVSFKTGLSFWNSRSGLIYSNNHIQSENTAQCYLKHRMLTMDLGMAFEFKLKKCYTSSGLTLLFPLFAEGMEIENSETQGINIEKQRMVTYRNGPGIRLNQDFTLWFKNKTRLFAGIGAGWIWAQRKSRILQGAGQIPVSEQKLHYLTVREISDQGIINDPALSGFNPELPIETQTYQESLSFLSLRWGLVFRL